jgi:hypothetical protein
MKKSILLFFLAALATAGFAQSQEVYAELGYMDDINEVFVFDDAGIEVPPLEIEEGMRLYEGYRIETGATGAEIELVPNGSIIRLSDYTVFQVDRLSPATALNQANAFTLGTRTQGNTGLSSGKIRAVARTVTNPNGRSAYNFVTDTAVMGVRGTDFILDNAGTVAVQEGLVDFFNSAGDQIQVGAGQFADVFASTFSAVAMSADQLAQFSQLQFNSANASEVNQPENTNTETPQDPADTPDDSESGENTEEPEAPVEDDPLVAWLKDVLGFEIGSVTIDGETYSKATIQPEFDLGDVKFGLYLPVIYTSDLFNPDDWYKPAGNNEWSFGSEFFAEEKWLDGSLDLLQDFALKFKYFQYGDEFDPFYIKAGNLNNMMLGHGSLVYNFANDADFPAVRQLGLNTKLWLDVFGIEFLTDNIADPSVLGGRLLFGTDSTHLGITTVADFQPMEGSDDLLDPSLTGDPLLLALGVDVQLFKAELGVLDMIAYIDTGAYLPYLREGVSGVGLEEGFQFDYIYNNDTLTNFGVNAGAYGKMLGFIDYRMEFQYFKGLYQPQLFGANYDRLKGQTYFSQREYLLADAAEQQEINEQNLIGVFGSAGFNLFDAVEMTAAYRWPWGFDSNGNFIIGDEDYFEMSLTVFKDVIPFVDLSGGVSYERTRFLTPFVNGTADDYGWSFFDTNTVVSGEIIYGVDTGLDLVAVVSTAVVTDAEGNIIYDGIIPRIRPTLNIETRVSF